MGLIRSNLNFEVTLKVKKAINAKSQKIAKLLLAIFGLGTGLKGLKFCTVPCFNSIYTFVFISFSVYCIDPLIIKSSANKNNNNNNNNTDHSMVWASPQTKNTYQTSTYGEA